MNVRKRKNREEISMVEYRFPIEHMKKKIVVKVFDDGKVLLEFIQRKGRSFNTPADGNFPTTLPEFYGFLIKMVKLLKPIVEEFKKRELGKSEKPLPSSHSYKERNIRDAIWINSWAEPEDLSYPVPIGIRCGRCGEKSVIPVYSAEQLDSLRCPHCNNPIDPLEDFENYKRIRRFLQEREQKFREFLELERLRKKLKADPTALEGFKKGVDELWKRLENIWQNWKEAKEILSELKLIRKYVFGAEDVEKKEGN